MVYIQAQYFPLLLYMKGDAYEEHFYFSFFTLRFYCIEVTKQYNSKALVEIHFCSSLSVGHSRRHVGGPTNWDIA